MIKLALALLGTLVVVPAAGAADRRVTMPATFFSPARAVAVVGDTVTWTNLDYTKNHTVLFEDGMFFSGPLARNQTATRAFPAVGPFPYRCTIHLTMRGRVDVFDLWLGAPARPVVFGRTAVLSGLAAAGTTEVALARQQSDGTFVQVATQAPAANGSVKFAFKALEPGVYQATGSGRASRLVPLAVVAQVGISARRLGGDIFRVNVTAKPVLEVAPVALQRYVKARASWKTVARKRLNRFSSARFQVEAVQSQRFRVVMTRSADGFKPGKSRSIRIGG